MTLKLNPAECHLVTFAFCPVNMNSLKTQGLFRRDILVPQLQEFTLQLLLDCTLRDSTHPQFSFQQYVDKGSQSGEEDFLRNSLIQKYHQIRLNGLKEINPSQFAPNISSRKPGLWIEPWKQGVTPRLMCALYQQQRPCTYSDVMLGYNLVFLFWL